MTQRQPSLRGTIAKAIIAFAVLLPVVLILSVAFRSHLYLVGLNVRNLTPLMVVDAVLLVIGLLLHRGEDL